MSLGFIKFQQGIGGVSSGRPAPVPSDLSPTQNPVVENSPSPTTPVIPASPNTPLSIPSLLVQEVGLNPSGIVGRVNHA